MFNIKKEYSPVMPLSDIDTNYLENVSPTKLKKLMDDRLSDDKKKGVQTMLDQLHRASEFQKLLLLLSFPTPENPNSNSSLMPSDPNVVDADPFGTSMNSSMNNTGSLSCDAYFSNGSLHPTGNYTEQSMAYAWIVANLEIDKESCLRKDAVYNSYRKYCDCHDYKYLNTADFGKVMKRAFPNIKPRRLGQRGQSKYCYGSMKFKVNLQQPVLPDVTQECLGMDVIADTLCLEMPNHGKSTSLQSSADSSELNTLIKAVSSELSGSCDPELFTHCISIILEWSQRILGHRCRSLLELAQYVITNGCCTGCSKAAYFVSADRSKRGAAKTCARHDEHFNSMSKTKDTLNSTLVPSGTAKKSQSSTPSNAVKVANPSMVGYASTNGTKSNSVATGQYTDASNHPMYSPGPKSYNHTVTNYHQASPLNMIGSPLTGHHVQQFSNSPQIQARNGPPPPPPQSMMQQNQQCSLSRPQVSNMYGYHDSLQLHNHGAGGIRSQQQYVPSSPHIQSPYAANAMSSPQQAVPFPTVDKPVSTVCSTGSRAMVNTVPLLQGPYHSLKQPNVVSDQSYARSDSPQPSKRIKTFDALNICQKTKDERSTALSGLLELDPIDNGTDILGPSSIRHHSQSNQPHSPEHSSAMVPRLKSATSPTRSKPNPEPERGPRRSDSSSESKDTFKDNEYMGDLCTPEPECDVEIHNPYDSFSAPGMRLLGASPAPQKREQND